MMERKYSKEEFNYFLNKEADFDKGNMSFEQYSEILNQEVFSTERFQNNIKETANNLNIDEELVRGVIVQMILYVASLLIKFHKSKLRINLIGFVYFDCLNPIFSRKSKQYFKNNFNNKNK